MRKRKKRVLILASSLVALVVLLLWRPWLPKLYTVTVLPTLGGNFVLPLAINERGQVAGFADVPKAAGATGTTYHLFLWARTTGIQDLGPVCQGQVVMNDAGQIASTMTDPNGQKRAFLWDPNHGRTILPTLGGSTSRGLGINDLGQVVGEAETGTGEQHAFLWDPNAGMRDLTPSSTQKTRAWSINDAGQIIVFGESSPMLIDPQADGSLRQCTIPLRGLLQITEAGNVAGVVQRGTHHWDVAIWREETGAKVLFSTENDSVAPSVANDREQVLLARTDGPLLKLLGRPLFPVSQDGCLWDPKRGIVSVDRYLDAGWGKEFWLSDLNNKGCIVSQVWSTKNPSHSRGVLLEPIPERWGE